MSVSDQRLLIDTDAFILFAGCDLLLELIGALGFNADQALRLHALPYMLGRSKGIAAQYPADMITKARAACDQIAPLEQREADSAALDRLITAHDDINGGEALLFAIALEKPTYKVISGDRRALLALGQSNSIADLRAKLHGRIVCLEVALRLLAERLGVHDLGARLSTAIRFHQSLKIFFSAGNMADESQWFVAVNYYYLDLRRSVGAGLLLNPFPDLAQDLGD